LNFQEKWKVGWSFCLIHKIPGYNVRY